MPENVGIGSEYYDFLAWARQRWGASVVLAFSTRTYKNTPQYRAFVAEGSPKFEGSRMPEWMPPTPPDEFANFEKWIAQTYGQQYVGFLNKNNYKQSEQYQYWQRLFSETDIPTPTGTEAQLPSTIGGAEVKGRLVTEKLFQRDDGTFEIGGQVVSPELAKKMIEDYYTPQKTGQRDFTQYTTRTSDEWERLSTENQRMQNAMMWEQARGEAMKTLTGGPRDWIRAWEMNQQRNPWIPTPRTEGEKWESSLAESRGWLQKKEPLYTAYKAALSAGVFDETGIENLTQKAKIETFISSFNDRKKQADATEGLLKAEFGTQASEPRPWGEAGNMTIGAGDVGGGAPRPTTPPTPSWLKQMYPQLGANITPQAIRPLSGQQWLSMPESQRQGWQGFAEWSGAIPMDVMSQMEMMLPNTPVGAGRTSWRPARQRGSF